jgi:hypothetical protein
MAARCLMPISHSFSRRPWPVLPEDWNQVTDRFVDVGQDAVERASEICGLLRSADSACF